MTGALWVKTETQTDEVGVKYYCDMIYRDKTVQTLVR